MDTVWMWVLDMAVQAGEGSKQHVTTPTAKLAQLKTCVVPAWCEEWTGDEDTHIYSISSTPFIILSVTMYEKAFWTDKEKDSLLQYLLDHKSEVEMVQTSPIQSSAFLPERCC